MNNFKFDRDFGIAYNCRYGRYGPTAPAPLVLFVPLYALAWLWAWAICRWRLLLLLAMLALIGCQAGAPVSPVATPDTWRPVPLVDFSRSGTGGHRTTTLQPNWIKYEEEIYIECRLMRGRNQVAENKSFQDWHRESIAMTWILADLAPGQYEVYCRAWNSNDQMLYLFSDDETDPDGWQLVERWQIPESFLFYLPIVWKRGRG